MKFVKGFKNVLSHISTKMFHAQKLKTEKYGICENLVKIPYFYVHV